MRRLAFAIVFVVGCSSSHRVDCRGVTCRSGDVCCDGICAPPEECGSLNCGGDVCGSGEICCSLCGTPACMPDDFGGECPMADCDAGMPNVCGGTFCGTGAVCCAGCPGEGDYCFEGPGCPDILCPPPPPACSACAAGERCCPGCAPGEIICTNDDLCPDLGCPPPPGCDACGVGQTCCPACPGDPPYCSDTPDCPVFDCPPPTCSECGPGETCCPSCPGEPPFCSADGFCPDIICPGCACPDGLRCCTGCDGTQSCVGPDEPCEACPIPICDDGVACPDGYFCDRSSGCGGSGVCQRTPTGCPRDCPGVCGCDGNSYCNSCVAASVGVDTAHAGECGTGECASRSYCGCSGGCEPLVDLSTGCICGCDDPFNCTGEICDCDCGGATYLGCAPVGQCADTTPSCGPGCRATLAPDGCPVCVCSTG